MPVSVRYSTAAELVFGVAATYLALAALRRLLLTHERGSGAEWHDGSREPSVSVRHDVSREPRVSLRKLKRQPSERHHENSDSDMDDEPESPSQTAYRPVPKSTCATVLLFGADGNLASTRVLPTLHLLWQRELLPPDLLIVGFARPVGGGGTIADTTAFREYVGRCCGGSPAAFLQRCHYATGQFDDRAAVGRCLQQVAGLEAERAAGRAGGTAAEGCVRMYYAAVPAFIYAPLTRALCENGVGAADGALKERFVFEKPFGHDTASCEALVADLARLPGRDVFWMDHYLGKELVMNLLILRFVRESGKSLLVTPLALTPPASIGKHLLWLAVEPARCQGGAGHLQGGARHRGARRLLRPVRHHSRRDAEPPAADDGSRRDGAASHPLRRAHPHRDAQGAANPQP